MHILQICDTPYCSGAHKRNGNKKVDVDVFSNFIVKYTSKCWDYLHDTVPFIFILVKCPKNNVEHIRFIDWTNTDSAHPFSMPTLPGSRDINNRKARSALCFIQLTQRNKE